MSIELKDVQTWNKSTRADGTYLTEITIQPIIDNIETLKTGIENAESSSQSYIDNKVSELNTTITTKTTELDTKISDNTSEINSVSAYISDHESTWNKGTTYTAGTNISIDESNKISVSGMYTNSEIDAKIGSIGNFEVVNLTTGENPVPDVTNPSEKVIYLTKETGSTKKDPYTEWIYTQNTWEIIGETTVDLSKYYTKIETNNILNDYAKTNTVSDINTQVTTNTNNINNINDKINNAIDIEAGENISLTEEDNKLIVSLKDEITLEAGDGIILELEGNKLKISLDPSVIGLNNSTLTFNSDVIKQ